MTEPATDLASALLDLARRRGELARAVDDDSDAPTDEEERYLGDLVVAFHRADPVQVAAHAVALLDLASEVYPNRFEGEAGNWFGHLAHQAAERQRAVAR